MVPAHGLPLVATMMLKIVVGERVGERITLQLEGQVVGPWVEELRRTCEPLLVSGHALTLDLSAVSFVDREGVALCRGLNRRRAVLENCSPFVREQLSA
jgi:ABC-type transporter Mla MlaB component